MSDQSRWQGHYPTGNGRMAGMIFGVPRKRPEGLQRIATGALDWLTGDKWDFDQRSGGPRNRDWDTRPTPPWGPGPGREFPHYPAPKPTPPTDQPPIFIPEPPLGQPQPPILDGPGPGNGPEVTPQPTPPFYPTPDGKPIPPIGTPPFNPAPPIQDGPIGTPPFNPNPPLSEVPQGSPDFNPEIAEMRRRGWGSPAYQAF